MASSTATVVDPHAASIAVKSLAVSGVALEDRVRDVAVAEASSKRSSRHRPPVVWRPIVLWVAAREDPVQADRWARAHRALAWVRRDRLDRRRDRAGRRAGPRCCSSVPSSGDATKTILPKCGACSPRSAVRPWTISSWRPSAAVSLRKRARCRRHTSWWRRFASLAAPIRAKLATPCGRTTVAHARDPRWARRRSLRSPRQRRPTASLRSLRSAGQGPT